MQIVGRPRDEESVLALAGRAHDAWGVGLPDVRTMDNP
jgi:hypothetical protein